jgi:hypothetical protein
MLNPIVKDLLDWADAEHERTAPERAELAARQEKEKQARQQHIELCDLLTLMKNCEPGLTDRESGEEISMANLYTIHSKRLINLARFLNEKGLLGRLDRFPTDCKGACFVRGLVLAGVSASDPEEIAAALERSARLDSFAAEVNYWIRSGLYETVLPDEWPIPEAAAADDGERLGQEEMAPSSNAESLGSGSERLRFDPETLTVTFTGTSYKISDPKGFAVYRELAKTCPLPLTKAILQDRVPGCRGEKKIRQLLNALPNDLSRTVRSGPSGYWLDLSPPPDQSK